MVTRRPRDSEESPIEPTIADILTDALQRAADAHHFHELENGPDPDWPRWYAEHMTRTLGEGGYQPSGSAPLGNAAHSWSSGRVPTSG